MEIVTWEQFIGAFKEDITFAKNNTVTTVAGIPFSIFDRAGMPGPGTLNIGNTLNGIVPVSGNNGYPLILSFGGSRGNITNVKFGSTVACRIKLFDRLFAAGAYPYNADVALASQPSFASRLPNGSYNNLELWMEHVTTFTGTPSFRIDYLNQNGEARDTGAFSEIPAALNLNRCLRMPLVSGDGGVQQINRVRCTVATAGTFNVMILRELWSERVIVANGGGTNDIFQTGNPIINDTVALYVMIHADSTSSGIPELDIKVAH